MIISSARSWAVWITCAAAILPTPALAGPADLSGSDQTVEISDGVSLSDIGFDSISLDETRRQASGRAVLPGWVDADSASQWLAFRLHATVRVPDSANNSPDARTVLEVLVNGFAAVQVQVSREPTGPVAVGAGWYEGTRSIVGSNDVVDFEYTNYLQFNGLAPGPAEVSVRLHPDERLPGSEAEVDVGSSFVVTEVSPVAVEIASVDAQNHSNNEDLVVTVEVTTQNPRALDSVVRVEAGTGVESVEPSEVDLALIDGEGAAEFVVTIEPGADLVEGVAVVDVPGFNSPAYSFRLYRQHEEPWWQRELPVFAGAALFVAGTYLVVFRPNRSPRRLRKVT